MRVVLVPRWGGGPDDDWYPRAAAELAAEVAMAPLRPAPHVPAVDATVAAVREVAEAGDLASTVLVGHSVGAQAVLRYLATAPPGARTAGTLCVAGWFSVDEPWGTLEPWLEPFDTVRARRAAGPLDLLVGDRDPFTADHRATRRAFEDRLGARTTLVPGAGHFNGDREPAVLAALWARLQHP